MPVGSDLKQRAKVSSATFTVGAESTNAINVVVQLRGLKNDDLSEKIALPWYLSSDATSQALATAPSGGIAIGTDGLLIENLANQSGIVVCEVDGDVDVTITDTGTPTMYLNLVLPDGSIATSGAITFA